MIEVINKTAQSVQLVFTGDNYVNARTLLRCKLLKLSNGLSVNKFRTASADCYF